MSFAVPHNYNTRLLAKTWVVSVWAASHLDPCRPPQELGCNNFGEYIMTRFSLHCLLSIFARFLYFIRSSDISTSVGFCVSAFLHTVIDLYELYMTRFETIDIR